MNNSDRGSEASHDSTANFSLLHVGTADESFGAEIKVCPIKPFQSKPILGNKNRS
jgi:hypothetical protein